MNRADLPAIPMHAIAPAGALDGHCAMPHGATQQLPDTGSRLKFRFGPETRYRRLGASALRVGYLRGPGNRRQTFVGAFVGTFSWALRLVFRPGSRSAVSRPPGNKRKASEIGRRTMRAVDSSLFASIMGDPDGVARCYFLPDHCVLLPTLGLHSHGTTASYSPCLFQSILPMRLSLCSFVIRSCSKPLDSRVVSMNTCFQP